VMSAPAGGGIIDPLIIIILMFITLPVTNPQIAARMFLKMGFIMC
jgi:hypothetical protein